MVAWIAEDPVVFRISLELVSLSPIHTRRDVPFVVHLESKYCLSTVMHLPFHTATLFAGDHTIEPAVFVQAIIP